MHPSNVHPSVCIHHPSSIHPSIRQMSIHSFKDIRRSVHPSLVIRPSPCPSIHPSKSIRPSIHPSVHPCPSVHPSIRPSKTNPSVHQQNHRPSVIRPSVIHSTKPVRIKIRRPSIPARTVFTIAYVPRPEDGRKTGFGMVFCIN
jgi:hypothetical protein